MDPPSPYFPTSQPSYNPPISQSQSYLPASRSQTYIPTSRPLQSLPTLTRPQHVTRQILTSKNLSVRGTSFTFQIENISPETAATLRRILMAEIPIMAIDCVEIYKNTSIMRDEILAQRLGLIPLTSSNITGLHFSRGCDCNCPDQLSSKCLKCSVILNLKVRGDSDKFIINGIKHQFIDVTSQDIIPENSNYRVEPVKYTLPDGKGGYIPAAIVITRLQEGQEIRIRCIAKKATGVYHAKFIPVSGVFFERRGNVFSFTADITGSLSPQELISELMRIYSGKN